MSIDRESSRKIALPAGFMLGVRAMLLQFAVENYLSFRDRAVLSMLADERVEHRPGQVVDGPGGRKILRSAILYGANGSGKSNAVKALGALRRMVVEGTRGKESLPIVPFRLDPDRRKEPSHFELELGAAGKHYSYGFEATSRQVNEEWLYEVDGEGKERLLFKRRAAGKGTRIEIGEALTTKPKRRAFLEFVAEGTRPNQLFLAEAGERNVTELGKVRGAFDEFRLVLPESSYGLLLEQLESDAEFRGLMSKVLQKAGTGIVDLKVVKSVIEDAPPQLLEVLSDRTESGEHVEITNNFGRRLKLDERGRLETTDLFGMHRRTDGKRVRMSMDEESDGTRRLLHLAPILHLIRQHEAKVLFVIDEIERSLHPLLTRMLLQLFFDRPKAAAQIFFTTHDTNLLDARLLSRDAIWLVEKDVHGGSSVYPLSDLDRLQVNEVEQHGDGLEKGYLQGRFGAIPFFGSLEALGLRPEKLR